MNSGKYCKIRKLNYSLVILEITLIVLRDINSLSSSVIVLEHVLSALR